jgi:hypothetical protein
MIPFPTKKDEVFLVISSTEEEALLMELGTCSQFHHSSYFVFLIPSPPAEIAGKTTTSFCQTCGRYLKYKISL